MAISVAIGAVGGVFSYLLTGSSGVAWVVAIFSVPGLLYLADAIRR